MRIVVAIDESNYSRAVVNSVLDRQWPDNTEIRLITVVEPLGSFFETPWDKPGEKPVDICKQLLEESKQSAQHLVDSWRENFEEKFGKKNVSSNVILGEVISGINHEIAEWKADLVVVGSHGKNRFESLMLGSVSHRLLLSAPCSIEIVKLASNRLYLSEEAKASPKNILVPVDDSKCSESVIEKLSQYKWEEASNFMILTVVKSWADHIPLLSSIDTSVIADADKDSIESANKLVCQLSESLRECKPEKSVKTKVMVGDPREKILKVSEDWPADLIIMGSHGRGAVMKHILGSVSSAVSHRSSCPIQIEKFPDKKF